MFHLLLNKIFLFTTTIKLFGAETRVTEIRQALKIWNITGLGYLGRHKGSTVFKARNQIRLTRFIKRKVIIFRQVHQLIGKWASKIGGLNPHNENEYGQGALTIKGKHKML